MGDGCVIGEETTVAEVAEDDLEECGCCEHHAAELDELRERVERLEAGIRIAAGALGQVDEQPCQAVMLRRRL